MSVVGFHKVQTKGVADYFAKKQAIASYMSEPGTVAATIGSEAIMQALGITATTPLDAPLLRRIMDGNDAQGNFLLKDQGKDQEHNPGWMFVLSDGKELSAAWALAAPDSDFSRAYDQARDQAMRAVLTSIEQLATPKNARRQGEPMQMLFNVFEHNEARDAGNGPDPQRHRHIFAANLGAYPDGTLGAIESGEIFEAVRSQWLGQLYQSEMVRSMRQQGFDIALEEKTIDGGKGATYKQATIDSGLTPEQLDAFSQRKNAIAEELAEHELKANGKNKQKASEATRTGKDDWTLPELRVSWAERAEAMGAVAIDDASLRSRNHATAGTEPEALLKKGADEARAALTALNQAVMDGQKASITRQELTAVMVKAYAGVMSPEAMLEESRVAMANLLNQGERYLDQGGPAEGLVAIDASKGFGSATAYVPAIAVERERTMRAQADDISADLTNRFDLSSSSVDHFITTHEESAGYKLSENQRMAIYGMGTSRLSIVEGVAGAGKSTIAKIAADAYTATGKKVIGLAFQGAAAEGLQESTGVESRTIDGFLLNERLIATIDSNTVFMIDEIGQCGFQSLAPIVELAYQRGAKIIGLGDEQQLAAINNRGAMGALKEAAKSYIFVDENRRQDGATTAGKEIGELARAGQAAKVATMLEKQGALIVEETQEQAMQGLARDYVEHQATDANKFIICETNAAAMAINGEVRTLLQEAGKLGQRFEAKTKDRDGDEATHDFYIGERIVFLQNSVAGRAAPFTTDQGRAATVKNSTQATIVDASRDVDGNAIIKARIGEGESAKIVQWNTRDYNSFQLGACVTAYKSQGATKQAAFVLVEGTQIASKETSYVSLTRHKSIAKLRGTSPNIKEWIDRSAKAADLRTLNQKLKSEKHRAPMQRHAKAMTKMDHFKAYKSERLMAQTREMAMAQKAAEKTLASNPIQPRPQAIAPGLAKLMEGSEKDIQRIMAEAKTAAEAKATAELEAQAKATAIAAAAAARKKALERGRGIAR